MRRPLFFLSLLSILCAAATTACAREPAGPRGCCAVLGYSRASVESVLGKPAPPASSKWHPFPSPPPNSPIYTTEHGYLTVTYAAPSGLATRFSMDFYEGKSPNDALRIISAYLPTDAADTRGLVSGPRASVRIYRSAWVAKTLPQSQGLLFVECSGAQPARLCEKADIAVGSP